MKEKIRILVADDEPVIRNLLVDVLSAEGYEVVPVENGKEAVEKVKKEQFQVIISDVHMPGMNGFEALKIIKEVSPKTYVIMMDSFPDLLVTLSLKEGAVTCLHKPFDINEVKSLVHKLISENDEQREKKEGFC